MRTKTATTAREDVPLGTVVEYHGSIEGEHGRHIVVGHRPNGRLKLSNIDYPEFTMDNVRLGSVTALGERVNLCVGCRHGYEWNIGERCGVLGCACLEHPRPALPGDVITARPYTRARPAEREETGYVMSELWGAYSGRYLSVWFPALGGPTNVDGEGVRMVMREEITSIRKLAELPNRWVTSIYLQLRKDPSFAGGQGPEALPLEARVKAIREESRAAREARRERSNRPAKPADS